MENPQTHARTTLHAVDVIDPEIEGYYVYFPFVDGVTTREHDHDFYEIFLIANGSIVHHVNGESVLLPTGSLVFVRPADRHYYSKNADHNCELINLAFLSSTFAAMANFLRLEVNELALLQVPASPLVRLANAERLVTAAQMKAWGRAIYRDKAHSSVMLRTLLAGLFAHFHADRYADLPTDIPAWLAEVCQHMTQTDHLIEGRDALMRLAKRTPEHVGRAFKTYLGVTPSQFVNDLRLDYASDLLLQGNDPIIDIAFAVGFGNLSHFNHLFKARWGCSPAQFRTLHRANVIP